MFIISKLISKLLLPPGLFIILLVVSLILLNKKKLKLLKIIIIINTILIYLLSIGPIRDLLILPLENRYSPINIQEKNDADFIVILGGGIKSSSPEENGKGSLSSDALKRLIHGIRLHKILKIPIIVSGGKLYKSSRNETMSKVAMRTLLRLGIEREKIFQEDIARNTWEEATGIKRKFSPDKVILVTSAYHMPRSIRSFNRNGIETIPAPTDYKGNREGYSILSFIPDIEFLSESYRALWEYIGYIYYLIRY